MHKQINFYFNKYISRGLIVNIIFSLIIIPLCSVLLMLTFVKKINFSITIVIFLSFLFFINLFVMFYSGYILSKRKPKYFLVAVFGIFSLGIGSILIFYGIFLVNKNSSVFFTDNNLLIPDSQELNALDPVKSENTIYESVVFKEKGFRARWQRYLVRTFNLQSITLAASMLALTVIIVKIFNFTIKIGIGGKGSMVIGFGFIPNVIFSFFNGPFFGFIFGFISDILLFILKPSFYSPIMALQKPIVGLLAGFFGLIYYKLHAQSLDFKKYIAFFISMQYILLFLLISSYFFLFFSDFKYYIIKTKSIGSIKWELTYIFVFAFFISMLFCLLEYILIVVLWSFNKKIKIGQYENILLFILIVLLQFLITLINSWILSPLHFLAFYQVDYFISLFPRLIKEIVLLPLRIFIYFVVLKTLLKIYYDKFLYRRNSY